MQRSYDNVNNIENSQSEENNFDKIIINELLSAYKKTIVTAKNECLSVLNLLII